MNRPGPETTRGDSPPVSGPALFRGGRGGASAIRWITRVLGVLLGIALIPIFDFLMAVRPGELVPIVLFVAAFYVPLLPWFSLRTMRSRGMALVAPPLVGVLLLGIATVYEATTISPALISSYMPRYAQASVLFRPWLRTRAGEDAWSAVARKLPAWMHYGAWVIADSLRARALVEAVETSRLDRLSPGRPPAGLCHQIAEPRKSECLLRAVEVIQRQEPFTAYALRELAQAERRLIASEQEDSGQWLPVAWGTAAYRRVKALLAFSQLASARASWENARPQPTLETAVREQERATQLGEALPGVFR